MSNERRNQVSWELNTLVGLGIAITAMTIGLIGLYYLKWPMWTWMRDHVFYCYIEPNKCFYLLSATAQVTGALFALVFSITFIAVQFSVKYTHRAIEIIFNWKLIIYMVGFACSVILPLWWLLNPTLVGTYISIVTGSIVVISLVFLFLDLRKRMNIGWISNYLRQNGLDES
jgi:hypothetical protein